MDGESQDFIILKCPPAEETDPEEPDRRASLVEEQLRHTQEKLCIKESEVDSGISTTMLKAALYKPDTRVRRKTTRSQKYLK